MSHTVFFDLDGTLTDPKPGITRCVQYALDRLGHAVPHVDELTWCIGPPLQQSFHRLVGESHAAAALDLYRQRFSDVGLYENTVYPQVHESLRALADAGIRLHVASSKPQVYVDRILDHFDLRACFDQVFGSELDGTRADKTELLRYALAKTRADPATATMVGDREHDAIGAFRNGLGFVGVLYGYGSAQELKCVGAMRFVRTPSELATELRLSPPAGITRPDPSA